MCEKGFTDPEETDATTVDCALGRKIFVQREALSHSSTVESTGFDKEPKEGGGGSTQNI
jgi:hypothetical protein